MKNIRSIKQRKSESITHVVDMPGVYKWLWLECIRNTDELPNVSLVKVRQESNGLGIVTCQRVD